MFQLPGGRTAFNLAFYAGPAPFDASPVPCHVEYVLGLQRNAASRYVDRSRGRGRDLECRKRFRSLFGGRVMKYPVRKGGNEADSQHGSS